MRSLLYSIPVSTDDLWLPWGMCWLLAERAKMAKALLEHSVVEIIKSVETDHATTIIWSVKKKGETTLLGKENVILEVRER